MRLALVPIALALLAAATSAQVTCDLFDVETNLRSGWLEVKIDTDLPEDTVLNLTVSRKFWVSGGSKAGYTIDYHNASPTVAECRKTKRIDITANTWEDKLAKSMERRRKFNPGMEVTKVNERLKLRIITPASQPNGDFGQYNKKLSGKRVQKGGDWPAVKFIEYFNVDAGGNAVGEPPKAVKVGADGAEPGKGYFILGTGNLHVHYAPRDAEEAAKRVVPLKTGTRVEIDRIALHEGTRWLRVCAHSTLGKHIGNGWMSTKELGSTQLEQTPPITRDSVAQETIRTWKVADADKALYEWIDEGKQDKSFRKGRRFEASVSIPGGLSVDALKAQCLRALWEAQERNDADGVRLSVYLEGLAPHGDPTAALATLAPKAKWSRVTKRIEHRHKLRSSVDVRGRYFKPVPESLAVGTTVVLRKEGAYVIKMYSDDVSTTGRDNLAASVTAGSRGKIKAVSILAKKKGDVIRYRVETENGKDGWVGADEVEVWE